MPLDDPVGMLLNGFVRLCQGLGAVAGDAINTGIHKGAEWSNNRSSPPTAIERERKRENDRLAGCKQVVLEFAGALGYLTREVMSPEELEELIDNGIAPDDLAAEFWRRVARIPGIILGKRPNGDHPFEIKLPFSQRDRHVYMIGRSGSGKTNLIRGMVLQDIYYGKGVGILAPEGELLTDEILPYIPEERIDDVVYINPADTDYPIPINPLQLDEGEDLDLKVDDTMTTFKRLMGETGARMDEILRQALYALMQRPGSTLLDIDPLLDPQDPTLRNEIIRTTDEMTARFFRNTYPHYPNDAHLPITTRINRLIRPKAVRTLLCQQGKSFNFRRAMDEGKILLFNLSDGILGEQTSQLIGELIVSKIQLAVMSRVDTPQALRTPFYLYLDEFQTFTGVAETSYEKILSRARKYKLGLILAHQQTGQIPQKLLREIFGNVSTFISFNISDEDARKLSREYAYERGVEVDYVPSGEFLRLKTGEAIGKIGRTVFPLQTYLLPQTPDYTRLKKIIERSRRNYSNAKAWEADVKKPTQKLLPPKPPEDDEPPLDPSRIF